jgi:hypothetical protein
MCANRYLITTSFLAISLLASNPGLAQDLSGQGNLGGVVVTPSRISSHAQAGTNITVLSRQDLLTKKNGQISSTTPSSIGISGGGNSNQHDQSGASNGVSKLVESLAAHSKVQTSAANSSNQIVDHLEGAQSVMHPNVTAAGTNIIPSASMQVTKPTVMTMVRTTDAAREMPASTVSAPPPIPRAPRRWTVEQEQADAWEQGETWHPPVYNPVGESSFILGVREDKTNDLAKLNMAELERHNSFLSDGVWDQLHGDPIGHAKSSIMRRNWMIEIYEDAYIHAIGIGMSNLASHAYAQIQVDKWKDKSLQDFEQTFGTHFAQLGQAISGDSLGNLQKVIAEGVPVTVVRTTATTAEELELGAGTTGKAITKGPPPIQAENTSILLANEELAGNCTKLKETPGWYNVVVHGQRGAKNFILKIFQRGTKQVIRIPIGAKTVKAAMVRTGYKGGPVILNSCWSGSTAEGVAQQLADELGEKVLAPTTKIAINKAGRVRTLFNGRWEIFLPTFPATP